jgi:cobalt-zinc-cadmium efflux system outer membrane protein
VGRQELFVQQSREKLHAARRALSATWNQPAEAQEVAGDIFATAPLEPLQALLDRLNESPRLAVLVADERLREAERRLAASQAQPDVTLALGIRHLSDPDDTGLVASASVPLGSRSRSRVRVAESEAQLRRVQAEQAVLRQNAVTTVGALHGAVEARRQYLEILDRDILPATDAAREQIERGYRIGRLSYGEYALSTREALDAELERLRFATEYHQLLNQLEGLIGTPVHAGNAGDPPARDHVRE